MNLPTFARQRLSAPMWLQIAPQGAAVYKPPPDVTEGAPSLRRRRRFVNRRSLGARPAWLAAAVLAIGVCAAVDWFAASTVRLYLDEDSAADRQEGTVWQHFAVRGNAVVPEIISRDEARFVFPVSLTTPHVLSFSAHPEGNAEYKINLRNKGTARQIAGRRIETSVSEQVSVPAGEGDLEFIVHGRITWFDLRLRRTLFLWPFYLGALLLVAAASRNSIPTPVVRERIGNWLVLIASVFISLAVIELVLRAVALRLPSAMLSARHELGRFAPDPRWIESPRYRQRLRPNLNTYCEWKFGDIVRMGFFPPDLFQGDEHRYPFQTDAEGFRNPNVREKIDVAALGDSFVDAMTSPVEESWTARLERMTGKKVQNYGMSAFGPQQELYVLQDYAIRHEPRDVILAFFAGNDLFDAERFDRWERVGDQPGEEPTGWRVKKRYRRYETLFLTTLTRVAIPIVAPGKVASPSSEKAAPRPRFDRGIYELPVTERANLRFALMPPYLQKLASSRHELEGTRGWELTRATLLRMKETCDRANSRFTIMFVPSKSQVYWPLVERALSAQELQEAIDFSCRYNHLRIRAAAIRSNRLAQNDLLRDFCAETKIPYLDLTPVLEQNAAAGRAVYFADDAHWNAAGHEVAAEELVKFLAREP